MAGRVVYTATINGNEDHNVDLASFEQGIYIINIATANGMVERKLVVQNKSYKKSLVTFYGAFFLWLSIKYSNIKLFSLDKFFYTFRN